MSIAQYNMVKLSSTASRYAGLLLMEKRSISDTTKTLADVGSYFVPGVSTARLGYDTGSSAHATGSSIVDAIKAMRAGKSSSGHWGRAGLHGLGTVANAGLTALSIIPLAGAPAAGALRAIASAKKLRALLKVAPKLKPMGQGGQRVAQMAAYKSTPRIAKILAPVTPQPVAKGLARAGSEYQRLTGNMARSVSQRGGKPGQALVRGVKRIQTGALSKNPRAVSTLTGVGGNVLNPLEQQLKVDPDAFKPYSVRRKELIAKILEANKPYALAEGYNRGI